MSPEELKMMSNLFGSQSGTTNSGSPFGDINIGGVNEGNIFGQINQGINTPQGTSQFGIPLDYKIPTTPEEVSALLAAGKITIDQADRYREAIQNKVESTGDGQATSDDTRLAAQQQAFERIDQMYRDGKISRDQADQMELQVTNGGTISQGTNSPFGGIPFIPRGGTSLNNELYSFGRGITMKGNSPSKWANIIGGGGAAALDIASLVLAGIGNQKQQNYVKDYTRKEQMRRNYTSASASVGTEGNGGVATFAEKGGEVNRTPQVGQEVKFMYEGKMVEGTVSKIENGQIYLK